MIQLFENYENYEVFLEQLGYEATFLIVNFMKSKYKSISNEKLHTIEMFCKCKLQTKFEDFIPKKECKIFYFDYQLHIEMITVLDIYEAK